MGCACLWQVPCSRLVCSIPVWENVDLLPLFIIVTCAGIWYFLKEESWMESLDGSSACSGGTVFLCITDGFSLGKGDIYIFLCAVVYTMHILVIDHFAPKTDNVKMSCIQFMVVGVLSVPFMMILETVTFDAVIKTAGPILYAGVMSSGVAYTVQIIGQKGMNPAVASLILSLESSISVLSDGCSSGDADSKRRIGCVLWFVAIYLHSSDQKYERKCIEHCVEI